MPAGLQPTVDSASFCDHCLSAGAIERGICQICLADHTEGQLLGAAASRAAATRPAGGEPVASL